MIDYKPVKWRWLRNGALIGAALSLTDLLQWRGPRFYPWTSPEFIAANVGQILGAAIVVGFVGLIAGIVADLVRQSKSRKSASPPPFES
ncbi:hypothetical protein V1291_004758 [Nitrobacteraceae bacterium AZCC 1564]